jgi:hypothetical protein
VNQPDCSGKFVTSSWDSGGKILAGMIHSSGIDASNASRFAALTISHGGFGSILAALKLVIFFFLFFFIFFWIWPSGQKESLPGKESNNLLASRKIISFSRALSVQHDGYR